MIYKRFLPVVKFEKVSGKVNDMSDDVVRELSSNQQYLYSISKAVQNGVVSEQLAVCSPGNYNHARWLTLANRILRLYVSTQAPTDALNLW